MCPMPLPIEVVSDIRDDRGIELEVIGILADHPCDANRAEEEEAMTERRETWPPEDIKRILDDNSEIAVAGGPR